MPTPPLTETELLEALRVVTEYGSVAEAARQINMNRLTLQSRVKAARERFPDGVELKADIEPRIASGFNLKSYSHLTKTADGELIWLKASASQKQTMDAAKLAMSDLAKQVHGLSPSTPAPEHCNDDLLTVIPMGDPHFGLLSWAKETGEDFDLEIAERLTFGAVDRLVALTPPTGTAMLLNLGDYFHADNSTNRTPRGGNQLDVDGRFPKIASIGFRAMIRCVDRLLEKHGKVIVRNNPGNHDPHQAAMLTIAVEAYYHANDRVEVHNTPSGFYFYRFGKVLIGSTHGDGAKLTDLPLIMATDAQHDWAASDFRVWHCGHFHHDQVKDLVGCTVETHRTLAAGDAWHRYAGYRAGRDMKAIVYSRTYGEVNRIRCGVEMLEAA